MTKVVHLTSAHPRRDTRIYLKECMSLAKAGYDVHIVVADGLGAAREEGIGFVDVGKASGRFARMANSAFKVFKAGLGLDADIYHLHDPELLPYGLMLKAKGKKVIFDAHEDLPAQIMTKPYLKPGLRRSISRAVGFGERLIMPRFDAVVGATPSITRKFREAGISCTAEVNNFPLPGELESPDRLNAASANSVCYLGAISRIRGIAEVVTAMGLSRAGVRLKLAGSFVPKSLREEVAGLAGWEMVDELGFVDRAGVRDILADSVAGIVTFLPAPNHIDAQPNKMFEYMSAGLPVIASDFPLWREIIADNECGILVDPLNPQAIAEAIDRLANDPALARRMGENGSRAVKEKYNWDIEEKKLLALYDQLAR